MNKNHVWKHIALWAALYVFWITIFQNRALTFSRTITVEFCYLIFIAANYYLHIYFSIPRLLYQKKYVAFGLTLSGAIVLGAFLRSLLAMFMNRHFFLTGRQQPDFTTIFQNSLVNIFVWVVCIIAVQLIIQKIQFLRFIDALEKEKTKNELDFLKAQFNPHFLFNSINSIYGHIEKGNTTARNMLLTFSEMLRYQLYECSVDSISIDKEINYIRNYVALQQTRKEENLIVNLNITTDEQGFKIAPMLFIAFIENAFKYVSNNEEKENKVEILLDKKEESLLFKTYNTKERNNGNSIKHKGIGIANVKRRLELQYPDRYNLCINDSADSYLVTLNIQLQ